MSLELSRSGDLSVSTYAGRAATAAGPFHVFEIYGGGIDTALPLGQGLDAIWNTVSANPEDQMMWRLRHYIGSMRPGPAREDDPEDTQQRFWPDGAGPHSLKMAAEYASRHQDVELLGRKLNAQDFVRAVQYVMTNTVLHPEMPGSIDPRLSFVDMARAEAERWT